MLKTDNYILICVAHYKMHTGGFKIDTEQVLYICIDFTFAV